MRNARSIFGVWLEKLATAAVVLVAVASMYRAFQAPPYTSIRLRTFSQLQKVADVLRRESDPVRREDVPGSEGKSIDGKFRLLDSMIVKSARVFALDMLGPENRDNIGFYYYLNYYLLPREIAISIGQPPAFQNDWITGRSPASNQELSLAGYDFIWRLGPNKSVSILPLNPSLMQPPETTAKPIPKADEFLALLLPVAVAIAGSRVVWGLFRDLRGILSIGELLASGLAVGAFILTQLILGLRLAGARLERVLAAVIMVWAVCEVVLLVRRWRPRRSQLNARHWWWLLLVPAAPILWCQFRLAGLLGLQEFDAVAIWAFKAKILHYYAAQEMWTWFKNPGLAYAHMDYPLLVPLLHAFTYGALGHVNEFVTKFWNQWMLLLLAWAVLGAGRFPRQRPWLGAAVALAVVLLPMTREYALTEGATLPMFFYAVLSSVQLAVGVVEKQPGRLRLGLLLLMAAAMVKFEGVMLLGLWGLVLLLDRDSRAALWPLRRVGLAGVLGMAVWLPYVVFRLQGPVSHPESDWLAMLFRNPGSVLHLLPMTFLAMLSRRFVSNDFAAWSSPDNQHVVWQGRWAGWSSLVDQWTQGVGWVCLLLLIVGWYRGRRCGWMMVRLCLVFAAFTAVVSLVWSATRSDPMNCTAALGLGEAATGGRHLYPVLISWFVAGVILLLRMMPGEPAGSKEKEEVSLNAMGGFLDRPRGNKV